MMNSILIKHCICLGHLFYAIANADKKITKEEKDEVLSIIEGSNLNLHSYEILLNTFSNLDAINESPENAFKVFVKFYADNKNLFNAKVNSEIIKASDRIAAAFSNKNKSELILLGNLSILLSKK